MYNINSKDDMQEYTLLSLRRHVFESFLTPNKTSFLFYNQFDSLDEVVRSFNVELCIYQLDSFISICNNSSEFNYL